jgi:hypothetical protein
VIEEVDNLNWDFTSQDDYRRWIEDESQGKFSFKVGVFDSKRASFDQYGFFFKNFIPDPPTSKKEHAKTSVLGEHLHHCVNLNAEHLFERPKEFLRQGDILEHQEGLPQVATSPSHWMVVSQTCAIANDFYNTLVPVYNEECLLENLVKLGLGTPISTIRQNKKIRLVWFPPTNLLSYDSGLVLDLAQSQTIQKSVLIKFSPILSFSFPGNAYMCCRLAIYQFRDVENWDDQRTTKLISQ